jgi:tRNA pseudouridine55 synthase
VRIALVAFVGAIEQRPSAVSAIKVEGRRAYERVRAGEQVDLPSRPVTVHELALRSVTRSGDHLDAEVTVHCSSGTYVRALARDLGERLGVGGHLTALRRTAVGGIGIDEAVPLADLEDQGAVHLMPMEAAAERFFRTVSVDADAAVAVGHGRPVELPADLPGSPQAPADAAADGPAEPASRPVAVLGPDGRFLALYAPDPAGAGPARPVAVFV